MKFSGDSAWILRIASTLITKSAFRVIMIIGIQPCNVFGKWKLSNPGIGSTSIRIIMALTSIWATTKAVIQGRLLARNGQVSLDTSTITIPSEFPHHFDIDHYDIGYYDYYTAAAN
ncbi:hypothetical protein N7509_000017 [Penicillium cosmopolitanum]|uniref:Uncharacterized protein n=1 Tax=Penicillium cosmopolitanum TaxID=1131564 RepID=A0A9X0BFA3_9EURO|nr:uncharacterized protein N7509_000017 [Penicillium cosmopolitanum]KAJ5414919.1 hypothetical protein N7509_000017 [Penicillium cosmopolitanum]